MLAVTATDEEKLVLDKRGGSIQAKLGDGSPSDALSPSTTPTPAHPATPVSEHGTWHPPVPVSRARSLPGETMSHTRSRLTGETVIGAGTQVQGRLTSEDTIHIIGIVEGELASTETILIETAGRVTATVAAAQIIIAGRVDGRVRGNGRIELRSTARMRGELEAGVLVIQEGAAFDGRVRMTEQLIEVRAG
jgi:cytoskeletal protein CcmA (bactofilin family)